MQANNSSVVENCKNYTEEIVFNDSRQPLFECSHKCKSMNFKTLTINVILAIATMKSYERKLITFKI